MKEYFNKRNISTGAIMSSLLIAAILAPDTAVPQEPEKSYIHFSEVISNEVSENTENINPFSNIKLTAKSAIVWDIKNQKSLFERNADEILPLASITKMLMALTAYESLPPNTEINIYEDFLAAEGDSGLYKDERWRVKDLIDFSLIASSNDAAKAIASIAGAVKIGANDYERGREVFIESMNKKASELGLKTITIKNESGLDKDEFESGAYGSAKDVAILFDKLLKDYPEILEATTLSKDSFTSLSGINHEIENTNVILNEIPGAIASKTGYTTLAGGNLAVIFDKSLARPVVVVVLGSTFNERFNDVKELIEASRKI